MRRFRHFSKWIAPLTGALILVSASIGAAAGQSFKVDRVIQGLEFPWALDFLPDGRMIVTERPGRLRILSRDGGLGEPLTGLPRIEVEGQGGLLDVELHPDFKRTRLVYLSYSEPGPVCSLSILAYLMSRCRGNSTAVARGVLSADEKSLENVETIFSQAPKVRSFAHFGSRVVLDGKGHLFVTLGDRSEPRFFVQVQDMSSHLGKLVRLNEDGTVPSDNPYIGQDGVRPEIWSFGHRNPQAAALHPETGALWEIEHGPKGGDEINIIAPRNNYGWPLVSFGTDYKGSPVGTGETKGEGLTAPIYHWTPSIAPSGMMFYTGTMFPEWQGNLFVGALAGTSLIRLRLEGDKVADEERLLTNLGERIRDVAQGPDGAIYLITDSDDGAVLRLSRS